MPEEKGPGSSSVSVDVILKWLPFILVLVGFVFAYGKRDDKTDLLIQQNAELRTMIEGLSHDLRSVSERLAAVEAIQKADGQRREQEALYRERTK